VVQGWLTGKQCTKFVQLLQFEVPKNPVKTDVSHGFSWAFQRPMYPLASAGRFTDFQSVFNYNNISMFIVFCIRNISQNYHLNFLKINTCPWHAGASNSG